MKRRKLLASASTRRGRSTRETTRARLAVAQGSNRRTETAVRPQEGATAIAFWFVPVAASGIETTCGPCRSSGDVFRAENRPTSARRPAHHDAFGLARVADYLGDGGASRQLVWTSSTVTRVPANSRAHLAGSEVINFSCKFEYPSFAKWRDRMCPAICGAPFRRGGLVCQRIGGRQLLRPPRRDGTVPRSVFAGRVTTGKSSSLQPSAERFPIPVGLTSGELETADERLPRGDRRAAAPPPAGIVWLYERHRRIAARAKIDAARGEKRCVPVPGGSLRRAPVPRLLGRPSMNWGSSPMQHRFLVLKYRSTIVMADTGQWYYWAAP